MLTSDERETNAVDTENDIGPVNPGLYGGCPDCQSAYGMEPREFYRAVHKDYTVEDEGGFSWYNCELCNSSLGGNRYAAHASKKTADKWEHTHLDICEDCLFATANGEPYTNET